jgi:general secretion pathway protein D
MRTVLSLSSLRAGRPDRKFFGLAVCCGVLATAVAALLLVLSPATAPAAVPDESAPPPAAQGNAPVPPEAAPLLPPPPPPPVAPSSPAPGTTPGAAPGEVPPAAPSVPAPSAPAPGTAPGAAPGETPPAAPSPPRKPLEGPITLNFKDASLRSVLEYLSEAAGLIVVQEATVEGRVTVMSRQPVSVDEAVSLLNTVLKDKGYTAVRIARTLRIVALDQAKKSALPVRSGNDPEKIELSDQLITQVIPIRSADAVLLKRDLATLIPSYADLSSNAATNTLILTDTQTNVRRFVEIVNALDTQTATVSEVRVYQLKYANAANAARLINDLFKTDQQGQQGGSSPFGSIRQFMFGGGGGPFGGGPRGESGEFGRRDERGESGRRDERGGESRGTIGGRQQQPKVTASSDDRTNTLVVSGPPELLKVIDDIVKQLDSNPTEEQAVFIYPLKNAKAVNIEGVLNNLFGWSGGSTSGRSSTMSSQQNTASPFRSGSSSRSSGSSRSGGLGSGMGSGGMGSGGFGSGGMGSGGFGSSSSRSGGFGSSASGSRMSSSGSRMSSSTLSSASDLVGQVFVVADEDTNSLLVTAATKNFERIKEILADLDRPVPQVLIKVLIAEVSHENTLDLGVEFSVLNMHAAGLKGSKGGTNFTNFSVAAQTDGFIISVLEDNITAAIHALATVGKLDVLSRPYILTSDNQQASIMVGEEVPFITRSQLTDTGQTINTIEYDDIGIILTVMPHINPDGLVIMDIYQEISAQTGKTVPISQTTTQSVDAPVFARRAAQSRVAIRDGQTIVIGGLMEDRNTDTVRKVPILGDIPWLGALFRQTVKDKTKTELLIFLTPHVAKVPDDLKGMSANELENSKVIRGAVEPGAFDEHMKGMNTGATPQAPEVEQHQPPKALPGSELPPAGARNESQR